jgi:hypothetical protein
MSKKVVETRIPMAIKTALKPRTKPTAALIRRGRFPSPKPTPPRIPIYEGINGSTHGERNESSPAEKINNSERFCDMWRTNFHITA